MVRYKGFLVLTGILLIFIIIVSVYGLHKNAENGQSTGKAPADVEITLWTSPDWKGVYDQTAKGANYGDFHKYAAMEFMKENESINIYVEVIPGAQREEKLSVGLQSNTQPDIYVDAEFVLYDYAHLGLLVPLNDIITEEDRKDIPKKFFDAVTSNGNIYMYPFAGEAGFLGINASIFKEADAEEYLPEGDIIAWTPEEFRNALRAVKKLGGVYPFGFYCGSTMGDTWISLMLRMYGAEFFNEEGTEVIINSPEGVKALEFLVSLAKEGLFAPGAETLTVLDTMQMFLNKKVAVSVFNNVNYDLLKKGLNEGTIEKPFELRIANIPSIAEPMNFIYDKGSVIFDTGNEQRIDIAKKFVKFYSSSPYVNASLNLLPFRKSVIEKMEDPIKIKMVEALEYAVDFSGKAPGYLKLRAMLYPEIQACISGEKSAEEALDAYVEAANRELKKNVERSVLLNHH